MPSYRAPLRDMHFVFEELLDAYTQLQNLPEHRELSADLGGAILEEAAKLAENVLAPLNGPGDKQGCQYDPQSRSVRTPDGFKAAYKQFAEGGWTALACTPEFGGQGLPHVLNMLVEEMTCSANLSLGMYPGLTHGAINALTSHGTAEQQQRYLPRLISGEWTGTMCLTEPQCGTDLGLIRTRAVPQADGSYAISGTKIWITGGEQDLVDNIIHLVLAKLPDAPAGSRGISLFLVPKVLVNDDGSLGERNSLSCGSIEHKMGIQASATCVMNFDGATGWMVGEPNKGLAAMFTMMNYERLGVGIQGLALGERSYQSAIEYARERIQSRAPTGPVAKDKAADPIIVHPDVRRMLLTMKALNEGGRAFSSYVAMQLDTAKYSEDRETAKRADELVALLTPVAKAFLTDMALETTVHGQQIFGGHGFIREWGQEQLVRDCRITQIYEGTNGIQSIDLVTRKLGANGGASVWALLDELNATIKQVETSNDPAFGTTGAKLRDAHAALERTSKWLLERLAAAPNDALAGATPYLRLFGATLGGCLLAGEALAAKADGAAEPQRYVALARFFAENISVQAPSLEKTVTESAEAITGAEAVLAG